MPIIELLSDSEDEKTHTPIEPDDEIIDFKLTQTQNPLIHDLTDIDQESEPLITVSKQTIYKKSAEIEDVSIDSTKDTSSVASALLPKSSDQLPIMAAEDDIIAELRARPTPSRFIHLITQYDESSSKNKTAASPQYLGILSTILIYNLPDLYTQLSKNQLSNVYRIFTSLAGLSSISSQIKAYLQQFVPEEPEASGSSSNDSPSSFLIDPMRRQQAESSRSQIRKVNTTYTKVTENLQTSYQQICLLLNLLSGILLQQSSVVKLFGQAQNEPSALRCSATQKETVTYLAGSKIYSMAAQCVTVFKQHPLINLNEEDDDELTQDSTKKWTWMGSPEEYARFLGFSLKSVLMDAGSRSKDKLHDTSFLSDLVVKSLRIDELYRKNSILHTVLDPHNHKLTTLFSKYVLGQMKPLDIRNILASHIIPFIDKEYLSSSDFISEVEASDFINQEFAKEKIRDYAGLLLHLLHGAIDSEPGAASHKPADRRKQVLESVTAQIPELASLSCYSLALRRVLALTLSHCFVSNAERERERALFMELLATWGKALNVRHTPIVAQQAQTEFITLWALQIVDERRDQTKSGAPNDGKKFIRAVVVSSPAFMTGISNRLKASSLRPRVCGIAVGEVLTKISAESSKDVLDFGMDEMYGQDLDYFRKELVGFEDVIGNVEEWWKSLTQSSENAKPKHKKEESVQYHSEQVDKLSDQDEELEDEFSDDEFKPLGFEAEPIHESDYSDEDMDDPSLNVLDKEKRALRPPVYIKDLISYLSDSESYDKQKLALECATKLIQQKSSFGQELKFFSKDLAATLVNMRDNFDMKGFHQMREEAVSMLVASDYLNVAPFLASLLVTRDFSNLQRTVILGGLATGAQLLAKYGPAAAKQSGAQLFASKKMTPALHERFMQLDYMLYGSSPNLPEHDTLRDGEQYRLHSYNHLKAMTFDMQQELLGGTAERAKEQLIGDSKVLRVSSTLEKKRAAVATLGEEGFRQAMLAKGPQQNVYAKVAYKTFFMPLVTQWYRISRQPGSSFYKSSKQAARKLPGGNEYYGMFVARFLTTLAMLLYLAAPSSTELMEMSGALLEIVMEQRGVGLSAAAGGNNSQRRSKEDEAEELEEDRRFYDELSFREGIYTAILSIVQVSNEKDGGESLVTRWPRQVVEMKMWVEEMWTNYDQYENKGKGDASSFESVIDIESKRVRGLAANILFLLDEIVSKWQRRLITEVMSIENDGLSSGIEGVGGAFGNIKIGTTNKITILR